MKRLIVLLLLSLVILSCGSSTDGPVSNGFIPLKAGNLWGYKNILHSSTGDTIATFFDTSFVESVTTIHGYEYYFFNNLGTLEFSSDSVGIKLSPSNIRLVREAADGIRIFNETDKREELTFKYPSSAGDTNIVVADSSGFVFDFPIVIVTMSILSTNESVTVEAGSFSCYHYEATMTFQAKFGSSTSKVADYYIAPGIGIVKIHIPNGSILSRQERIKTLIFYTKE